MVNIIVTSLLIALFFIFGHMTQAFKKLFSLLTNVFLRILSFFGIKIKRKEHSFKVSDDFKSAYKDIKKVKLSKKNIKQKSSIDWLALSVFLIAGILVIINFGAISGNIITNWLFKIQPITLIKTAENMNTFFTATMFSIISFSISRLLTRWKETKQDRKERKELKIKSQALGLLTSKELLNEARKKDKEEEEKLK